MTKTPAPAKPAPAKPAPAKPATPAAAPTKTVTKSVVPEAEGKINFTPGPVPEHASYAKPNPYLDAVKGLVEDVDDDGTSQGSLSFPCKLVDIDRAVRYLQNAGKDVGATVRNRRSDPDKSGVVTITFWTTKRITRRPKTGPQDAVPVPAS